MRISAFFKEKWAHRTILLLAFLALAALLCLTQFIHPAADDYGYALRDSQQSFWAIQKETYLHWSGRYFGTAILQLNPLQYGSFTGYRIVSFCMILGFAAGLYLLVEHLFKTTWPASNRRALAALLFLLYLVQCPSLPEAFFWLTGFLTYTVSCVLFLLVLVLLRQLILSDITGIKTGYWVVASALGVMIIGSNEISLIMLMSTLLVILAYHWQQKTPSRFHLMLVFLICLFAALVMVLAPGNYQRMGEEAKAQNLLWSVLYSTGLTVIAFVKWAIPLIVGSLVYILYIFPKKSAGPTSKLFAVDTRWIVLVYVATLFAMHFLFVWSTGERPTPRLENVIYFYLFLGWFYLLHLLLVRYQASTSALPLAFPRLVPALVLLLFAGTLLTQQNPFTTAFSDIVTGKAAGYHAQMQARYELLTTSRCKTCALPPLTKVPASITFIDIAPKDDTVHGWVNVGTAAYWKKDSVYLSQPNPPLQENKNSLVEWGKTLLSN
ncbi:hypothetical protein GU926_18225 [Nibribacter ruber]|uniref:Glycosyltransferase RgtA/B/C/D-like domain-containing protein n=1 Tax=Nibribacter ruber TaxID=2698458 RepID=A0A6P1P491_9BACT|nr:DUF6056 family protein [Nibribacter ruber]QHL89264.1 hypothetical protein GU926_18225 [Nibribacter ruber]